jgi:4-carboxymuconolactone decarboxylase
MGRLVPLKFDELNPEQREIVGGEKRRAETGPFTVWLRRPKLARMTDAMMKHLRRGGLAVPGRLAELAILIAARAFTAQFAWHAHEPQAVSAGVEREVIEDLRHRRTPKFKKEDEALVYAFAIELLDKKQISDATYKRALDMFGQDMVIDLVNLLGCYAMIACNLVAFQVDVPGGEKPLPP